MKKSGLGALLLFLALVPSMGAQGQGKGKKNAKKDTSAVSVSIRFSDRSRTIILDWFSKEGNRKGLPPGLAKHEELPPGLRKQLVRNGTLPPGLEKKLHPLPADLEARLPPPPQGTRRVILSGSVILLGKKTSKIFDIIEEVVR